MTPVTADFSGTELVAPVEQTTENQLLVMQAQVLRGKVDHVLRFAAVPGAEVTVTVNGVETSAVAGRSGIAEVPARFRAGVNAVSVSQALDGSPRRRRSTPPSSDHRVEPPRRCRRGVCCGVHVT